MRTYITIIILIFCLDAHAQSLYDKERVLAKNTAYTVKHGSASIAVYNVNNGLLKKKSEVSASNLTQIRLKAPKSLLNNFQSVFSNKRLQELLPEGGLTTGLYVNPAGKVLEVVFFLNKDSRVTPDELEALEKAIKQNVVFSLNPEQTEGGDFFIFTKRNKYQKILDGTLEWE